MKINKPKKLNSLDYEMMNSVYEQIREWKRTEFPKVLLVSGEGGKAFCAGGDMVSIYKAKTNGKDRDLLQKLFAKYYIVDYALSLMPTVQISIWNGIVMGGGVGISCISPIRICMD